MLCIFYSQKSSEKLTKISSSKLKPSAISVTCGMVNFNTVISARQHAPYINPSIYPAVGFLAVQGFLNFSSEIKQGKISRIFRISCYLPRLIVIAIYFFLVVLLIPSLIYFNILNIIKLQFIADNSSISDLYEYDSLVGCFCL